MTKDEYQSAVVAAMMCARLLKQHDIAGILNAISRADAVGWAIDPTLYRDKQEAMHQDQKLLEAALRLALFAPKKQSEPAPECTCRGHDGSPYLHEESSTCPQHGSEKR